MTNNKDSYNTQRLFLNPDYKLRVVYEFSSVLVTILWNWDHRPHFTERKQRAFCYSAHMCGAGKGQSWDANPYGLALEPLLFITAKLSCSPCVLYNRL